ncbi:MAG: preprotein translocase subunit SecG [Acidobacteria bacterium]|nr:preprotein translocase subunit SecG [Acidobacteriota bacterium]
MVYFLYGLFFLSCLVLVAAVLLQPGKTDAGALFTSNVSSSAFAPRGTATVLSKVTITAAAVFMLSALLLAMPALNGNVSVVGTAPDANSESSANTNSNTSGTTPSTATDTNSNGALVETPATDQLANKASANVSTQPVNTAVAPVGNANKASANANAKTVKSPVKK